jgi:hypothetical protein
MTEPTPKPLLGTRNSQPTEGRPTHEEIELRAYQIYCERAGTTGTDVGDWLQAEREMTAKHKKTGRAAKAAAV